MFKFLGVFMVTALVALSPGCNSKKSKCQKGFNQMADTAKSFSGIANLVGKALGNKDFDLDAKVRELEPKFMEVCLGLSDEALDCVANIKERMLDPTCLVAIAKLPKFN